MASTSLPDSNVTIDNVTGGTFDPATNEITLAAGENIITFKVVKGERYYIKPKSAVRIKILEMKETIEN